MLDFGNILVGAGTVLTLIGIIAAVTYTLLCMNAEHDCDEGTQDSNIFTIGIIFVAGLAMLGAGNTINLLYS